MKISLEIKDSDGVTHHRECDDYNYNVDTKSVLCYETEGDKKLLIAAFEDISHFRRVPKPEEEE